MKWFNPNVDLLLILSNSQLFLYNLDKKESSRTLPDIGNCIEFTLFENENLFVALLCGKSIILASIQNDQEIVAKQIFSLDEIPISINISKNSIILQYFNDIERIILNNNEKGKNQIDKIKINSAHGIIYIQELEVYGFFSEGKSFFVPDKGPFDLLGINVKWNNIPYKIFVIDPYLIGLSEKGIEIHHYYKPHAITQFIENVGSNIVCSASSEFIGNTKEITDIMPALFLVVQRAGKITMCKFEQISLEEQCNFFVKYNEFKLALNTCDTFIHRKYKKSVTVEEYMEIQRERGCHLFVIEKNYKKAKKIFSKYEAPPEEIILLFAELLQKSDIEKLIKLFNIDAKNPINNYLNFYSSEELIFPSTKISELSKQLKVFLLFFLEKRKQLTLKITKLRKDLLSSDSGLNFDKNIELELEKNCFLKMLYEMAFFHGCLILIIKNDPDASLVENEFYSILNQENSLPSMICEELLIKYELFTLLFKFLISKKQYSRVFTYLKEFYQNMRKPAENYSGEIKQFWLNLQVKCAQEISQNIDEYDFLKNLSWLIETGNLQIFLECLKIPPKNGLFSNTIINFIREKAGNKPLLLHLEYLLNCENPAFIKEIPTLLIKTYINSIEERARQISSSKGEAMISLEEINNDSEIVCVRAKFGNFLENLYEIDFKKILEIIPPYLFKEKGILLIREGNFISGFNELIVEAQLPLLAIKIGEEYYAKTENLEVLLALIKCLFESSKLGNNLKLATTLLERYFDKIESNQIISLIPEEIEIEKIGIALSRIIDKELTLKNNLKIAKNCERYKLLEVKCKEEKIKGKYRKIEGGEICEKCQKSIGINESDAIFVNYKGGIFHYRCADK